MKLPENVPNLFYVSPPNMLSGFKYVYHSFDPNFKENRTGCSHEKRIRCDGVVMAIPSWVLLSIDLTVDYSEVP